jgi:hypothetical protein
MEAEMVSETLGFCPQLTRLVSRQDFIELSRRESFKSYPLMMEAEIVSETLGFYPQLTRLVAREDVNETWLDAASY